MRRWVTYRYSHVCIFYSVIDRERITSCWLEDYKVYIGCSIFLNHTDIKHELTLGYQSVLYYGQWRIYIEAKEAVLGGPRTQRAPQIYKKNKNGCRITIQRNAFNKIVLKLLI